MPSVQVLLVEDDLRVREVLAAYLEVDGYTVALASDGQEGYDLAMAEPPALIVTDIMMPRMDGVTMVRRLRQTPQHRATPVLLISGHSDPPVDPELRTGPLLYIAKPVTLGGFLGALRKLLRTAEEPG
ncbi:MAG: response regulator [Armatimonadetes bacterium]|nr:response regulator [Armatimonadota bacterium]